MTTTRLPSLPQPHALSSRRIREARAHTPGRTARLARTVAWLAVAAGVLLLLFPFMGSWPGLLLLLVGVGIPLARWAYAFLTFDVDFSELRLTEDEVREGLDW